MSVFVLITCVVLISTALLLLVSNSQFLARSEWEADTIELLTVSRNRSLQWIVCCFCTGETFSRAGHVLLKIAVFKIKLTGWRLWADLPWYDIIPLSSHIAIISKQAISRNHILHSIDKKCSQQIWFQASNGLRKPRIKANYYQPRYYTGSCYFREDIACCIADGWQKPVSFLKWSIPPLVVLGFARSFLAAGTLVEGLCLFSFLLCLLSLGHLSKASGKSETAPLAAPF